MWIRSQDKKILTEIHDVEIDSANQIWGSGSLIGEYSTENKAMKVMDMIEDRIRLSEMFKLHIYEPLNRTDQFVFQLPKDDDF